MLLLNRIPAPLHRLLYRLAHWARRQVWKVRRPRVDGVRVLALDAQRRVLLIRHSYGSDKWMPPGGGLRKGEEAVSAGAREFQEETGCRLLEAREAGVLVEDLHGASNVVHVIVGRAEGEPRPDGREIVDARFFALDALPDRMPAGLAEGVRRFAAA